MSLAVDKALPLDPTRVFDVTDVLIGKDGSIYVRQEETANISVLDEGGRFVRTIGLRGDGAGRFMGSGVMGWHGDTLWSTDNQTRRIEFYSTSGKHYRSQMLWYPLVGPVHPQLLGATLTSGRVLTIPSAIPEYFENGYNVDSLPLLSARGNGYRADADTIRLLSAGNTYGVAVRQTDRGMRMFVFKQPLSDDPLFAVSRDGSAFVIVSRSARLRGPHTFRVEKYDGAGVNLYDVSLAYEPIQISPSVLDSLIPAVVRTRGVLGPENLYQPPHVPAVTAVLVARDGDVWIQREQMHSEVTRWDVLDATGRLRKTVDVETGIRLLEIDGDHVWGIREWRTRRPKLFLYRIVAVR